MKKLLIAVLALGLMLSVATTSEAVPLPDFTSVATTGAASPGGTLLASIIGTPFSLVNAGGATVGTGTLSAWVRRDTDGFLVFEYMVSNTSSTSASIRRVSTTSFLGWTTAVDADGSGDDPDSADRDDGTVIGFNWVISDRLNPGETSSLMWVKTDATNYGTGSTQIIDGGIATVSTFAPAVPEPSSMILFGTGMLGFIGRLRKRFNA